MDYIFLALGSNVGNRIKYIHSASELLGRSIKIQKFAPVYESKPVGSLRQPTFLNSVIAGTTSLNPLQTLAYAKSVEQELGRIQRYHWGPREIDIDVLLYNDLVYKNRMLEIPHSRLHERDFVLRPLLDIAPDLVHPVHNISMQVLFNRLGKKQRSIIRLVCG
jgi:2-amino-4-hydroxy-6-hydroxymethyldihydropteridine diphosphokinase